MRKNYDFACVTNCTDKLTCVPVHVHTITCVLGNSVNITTNQ